MATKLKAQKAVFSPSVNIIRDADVELNYIPTSNAKKVYTQLINDYQVGIRSFNIIGTYGTGKSAFLWAFERHLNRKQVYFSSLPSSFRQSKEFKFLSLVGEYDSIIKSFAKQPGINIKNEVRAEDIIISLDRHYKSLHKAGKGLVILIDEFGKYLEYAAKNNPEEELYFIQLLAEYVNDSKKNIFFITTLHQDFYGYARGLSDTQRKEWDKVKGRLHDVTFNEPVEQLLFLASERLQQLGIGKKDGNFSKLFKAIDTAKVFPLKDYFSEAFAEKLLPFDILSAAFLTLALQRYGQNERSLFSFIESNDQFGIHDFNNQKTPYYNLSCLYDYLTHNYYAQLTTLSRNHDPRWFALRSALERTEAFLSENVADAMKMVKAIGMLNIFALGSAKFDAEFLCSYGKYSLGIKNPEKIIDDLNGLRIIRFVKYNSRYMLAEGTDLNIELAIDEAGNLVEKVSSVVHHLNTYFDFPYISAKAAYYEKGTPRFFGFHLSEKPVKLLPEGEIDGFVNLIFSNTVKEKDIKDASANCKDAVLYGWYKNTNDIANSIFEIEKIKKVRENHLDDRFAVKELDIILQHQVKLLNHYVLGSMFAKKSPIQWFFQGKPVMISNQRSFNHFLSQICYQVYDSTPLYKNEMVNKSRLSGVIAAARKNFLSALTENWFEPDLGFDETKFPPEKTIYLSLLKDTGIHREEKTGFIIDAPNTKDRGLTCLWKECTTFLESTRNGKRDLEQLTRRLLTKPFKLKQGFIDFWLPVFLFSKRDDFALFHDDIYIPYLTQETLELISKNPREYEIKAFAVEGVNVDLFNSYRAFLSQSHQETLTAKSFIETIRPFLIFYRQLPEYSKTTSRLEKKTLALRQAIAQAKDPEDTFFEQFPKALGFTVTQLKKDKKELAIYVTQLKDSIREIRTCYDELIKRTEVFIQQELVGSLVYYPEYKTALQDRFKKLKKHLLLPYQKVFYQRLNSELDDNKAWLNSIAQACIGKTLEMITDEEEKVFCDKLKDIVHELDNLCEISKSGFDEEKEIAFKLEITSFVEGLKRNLVRLPKSRNKELIQLHSIVKAKLSDDRQLNIATLAKLLEDLLKNEK